MGTYIGPERRHHQVLLTRNTEYHLRDGLCIAVRDRKTGRFRPQHAALGRQMRQGIRFTHGEGPPIFSPEGRVHVGEAVNFSSSPLLLDLVTTPLEAVKRPPKWVIETYPR
jgi:hypothetical protein